MKASGQDAASSSSPSRSAPDFPNPVLRRKEGEGADEKKSMMCANHFELGKDDQLRINHLPGFYLNFRSASQGKIGICVPPKETFVYKPKRKHAVYLFEVGLPKQQAESVLNKIQVYLRTSCGKDGRKRILIGTLSKENANIRLDMVLSRKMELSHNAVRKNVYFNAFELKRKRKPVITIGPDDRKRCPQVSNHMKKTNKEIWVAEVRPSQKPVFRPSSEGKVYTLLKVFSETRSEREIELFVESKGATKLVGTISEENPSTDCEFQFDEIFCLSHSSSASTVVFWGYTVSSDRSSTFKLEDLTSDPSPLIRLQPPKKVADGEHNAYEALLTKKRTGANIKRVDLVPVLAPVIRAPPDDYTDLAADDLNKRHEECSC